MKLLNLNPNNFVTLATGWNVGEEVQSPAIPNVEATVITGPVGHFINYVGTSTVADVDSFYIPANTKVQFSIPISNSGLIFRTETGTSFVSIAY